MTPKENAERLYEKFRDCVMSKEDAQVVAERCVDELIGEYLRIQNSSRAITRYILEIEYWKDVKKEIESL